ncbi:MAG TPA: hypothetical protein VF000_11975 [Agromyces sp.]
MIERAVDEASTRRGRMFRRPSRSARAAGDVRESHGGRRLATGITIAAVFIVLAHLMHAMAMAEFYRPGPGPWPAWVALGVILAVGVVSRFVSRTLPDWLYVTLLVALILPVWLDVAATAGLLEFGVMPTAAAAAGAILMPVTAIRGTRVPPGVSIAVAAVLVVAAALQATAAGPYTVAAVAVAATACFPVLLALFCVTGFRRLARRELDLSLVQSTVGTPRSAVGMRASEELARLDFDAETLLDGVGSGRIAIPLPPDAAETAAALAARLRVRLIEGRTDTWLRHAVTESAYLSDRVTVEDPAGCAGLLSQEQRDGLLLALWLLVAAERTKRSLGPRSVTVECRETMDEFEGEVTGFDMSIEVFGLPRRRVDPATWDAIGSVGVHDVVTGADNFRIDIACRVDPHLHIGSPVARGAARSRRS